MAKVKKNGDGRRTLFHYRYYNFADKDPVIDRIRTMIKDEGLSYNEVHIVSGVSTSTISNWLDGETKKPQYATIAAVTASLGYKQEFVKSRDVDYGKELAKARKEIEQAAKKS